MADERRLPRYPVYIPTKGRWDSGFTMDTLTRDGVPYYLVVEPQEAEDYRRAWPGATVLELPFSNLGQGSIPARNWIMQHAIEAGAKRHWQLDDNIERMARWYRGKRLTCRAGAALSVCEDFVDRYENVAVAGLNYDMFARGPMPPFNVNCHVYSCTLVLNSITQRWRGRYNEDTDICLQVLAAGWCTVLLNAFLADKLQTMSLKGGNTDQLYAGDGRLKMARSLERVWPGVVTVCRRFKRPQHVVDWAKFKTPLKRRADIPWAELPDVDERGLTLKQIGAKIKSARLRKMVADSAGAK